MLEKTVLVDGYRYNLTLKCEIEIHPEYPRLIIPAYLINKRARDILKACLCAILHYTPESTYEVWVVDNGSPSRYSRWLFDFPGINVVQCHTPPRPPEERGLIARMKFWRNQKNWGSYANAVGIAIALEFIDAKTRYIVPMHSDTMPVHPNWLNYLKSCLDDKVKGAGVYLECCRFPEGVLHAQCFLLDYQIMQKYNLDFYPELPAYDATDKISTGLRDNGFDIFASPNTYLQPDLINSIPCNDLLKNLHVVRAFDDKGNIFFLHLGRGTRKAGKQYKGHTATVEDWLAYARNILPESH